MLVVYGMNGMDELSLSGESMVGELVNGQIREYVVHPADFGMPVYDSRVLRVADVDASKAKVYEALDNVEGPVRDIVLLNAGAALYAAQVCASISEGVTLAREAVASGAARAKLEQFVRITRQLAE